MGLPGWRLYLVQPAKGQAQRQSCKEGNPLRRDQRRQGGFQMKGRLSAEEEQDQHDSGEEKTGWLPGDEQQKNGDQDEEQERAGREGASG